MKFHQLLECLLFLAMCYKSCSSQENKTPSKPTCTTGGYDCVFPFMYDGKEYNSCMPPTKRYRSWCGIKYEVSGYLPGVDWDYCEDKCSPSNEIKCTDKGHKCLFPILYKGKNLTRCITYSIYSTQMSPWCFTTQNDEWEYCAEDCPNDSSSSTTTKTFLTTRSTNKSGLSTASTTTPAQTTKDIQHSNSTSQLTRTTLWSSTKSINKSTTTSVIASTTSVMASTTSVIASTTSVMASTTSVMASTKTVALQKPETRTVKETSPENMIPANITSTTTPLQSETFQTIPSRNNTLEKGFSMSTLPRQQETQTAIETSPATSEPNKKVNATRQPIITTRWSSTQRTNEPSTTSVITSATQTSQTPRKQEKVKEEVLLKNGTHERESKVQSKTITDETNTRIPSMTAQPISTTETAVNSEPSSNRTGISALFGALLAAFMLGTLGVGLWLYRRRRKMRKNKSEKASEAAIPLQEIETKHDESSNDPSAEGTLLPSEEKIPTVTCVNSTDSGFGSHNKF